MESLVTSSADGDPVAAKPSELGGPAGAVAQILTAAGVAAGAGFLVPGGVVVTCAHVVCDAGHGPGDEVEVCFPQASGAPKARGRVLTEPWRRPEREDTAVIQLDRAPSSVPELLVGLARGAKGRPAWSFGFPRSTFDGGHEGTATAGGPLRVLDHWVLQLHDANTVARGFSGAPVVDTQTGLVIGMVTSLPGADPHQRGLNIAYATPGEILREVWPALKPLDVCPYQDFRAFTYERARWFHGRDRAKEQLLRHLVGGRHGVLVQGPSGSGKSSLVQAGVLPELPSRWRSVVARPARGLLADLELAGLPGAVGGGILASAERFHPLGGGTRQGSFATRSGVCGRLVACVLPDRHVR